MTLVSFNAVISGRRKKVAKKITSRKRKCFKARRDYPSRQEIGLVPRVECIKCTH